MLPQQTFRAVHEYFHNDIKKTMLWFQKRHHAFDMMTPLDYMKAKALNYKNVDRYITQTLNDKKPL